jgi:hypothetical protein
MKSRFNLFLIFYATITVFFQLGCVTNKVADNEKDYKGYKSGQWETQALIKNHKSKKSQTLDIDIFAIQNEKARFEISALLGFQVASLVISGQNFSYIVYPEKAYFFGDSSSQSLEKSIGLPLNIMNLANIAFEQPIRGFGWKCNEDASGALAKCENSDRGVSVAWFDRQNGQKNVLISAPQFEMRWRFNSPKTQVQFKAGIFTLKQPEGFKAIHLN